VRLLFAAVLVKYIPEFTRVGALNPWKMAAFSVAVSILFD
jgi:hypothetical protein